MRFTYDTIRFYDDKEGIRADFLRQFTFTLPTEKLRKIGPYRVDKGSLIIDSNNNNSTQRKFKQLLAQEITQLTNRLNGKPTTYIHQHSGIPLIGHNAFGITDRNSTILEIKPITSCNVACTFCSVTDERRIVDFVIEKDYLVKETKKLVILKKKPIEIFINAHGEPTLYADLPELIQDLAALPGIRKISMISNATLLTAKTLKELHKNGLDQLNISINATTKKEAKSVMGQTYYVEPVLKLIKYAATFMPIILAPVWLPGHNDKGIEDIIRFAKSLEHQAYPPRVCIQNFLEYQYGSNPTKQKPWEQFYKELRAFEEQYAIKLIVDKEEDFNVEEAKVLTKPFKKGEIIEAEIKSPGRLPREKIGVAKNRCISIMNCTKDKGKVRIKLTKSKHNIFVGIPV